MKSINRQIEILAPAGSYESLKAAITAGADAVYIGGSRFGARAYADNLQEEQLLEAIDYVHLHGKKIYLTVNTLLKEKEVKEELYSYLLPYYKQGIDAVIVQDIGVLQFIKKYFPNLPIHASTQMTITNVLGAKLLEKQGVERVVTARELQLDEIKEISENTSLEIESFVHGSLCYCYSGQCLYSSIIGRRSGNRGQCAQPCRLPYRVDGSKDSLYVLSLKDICTLEYIPELIETGITSFKIEGRMKKPEYVALVTAMYRKYTDLYFHHGKEKFKIDVEDRNKLMDLYNRGGSHGGYYHVKNGREMVSLDRPNHTGVPALKIMKQQEKCMTAKALVEIHEGDVVEMPDHKENYTFRETIRSGETFTFVTQRKQNIKQNMILNRTRNERLLQEIKDTILSKKRKESINGRLTLSSTEPSKLTLTYKNVVAEVFGETASAAINQPMDILRVEKQMRKTGNTEFEFKKLDVELTEDLFLPMQSLNELRRNGIEELERRILACYRREISEENMQDVRQKLCASVQKDQSKTKELFHVYVETSEQFQIAVTSDCIKRIYLDCNAIEHIWENQNTDSFIKMAHKNKKEIFLGMPHIFRADTCTKYKNAYHTIFDKNWDGVLLRNYESYEFLCEHQYTGKQVVDYNLYQFNQYAKEFWQEKNIESLTAPLELNYRELKAVGLESSELIVYGYFPMMISVQCVKKTVHGCTGKCGTLILKDRCQKDFLVKNNCDYCYNVIYNTAPVVLTDQKNEIEDLNVKAIRLHFTIEGVDEMQRILHLYKDVFLDEGVARQPETTFTRGHFKRGIK